MTLGNARCRPRRRTADRRLRSWQPGEQGFELPGQPFPGKFRGNPGDGRPLQGMFVLRIGEQAADGFAECEWVSRRNEYPRLLVFDELRYTADGACHDARAGCHRFEHDEWARVLPDRRHDNELTRGI